jgi:hypothetical protein
MGTFPIDILSRNIALAGFLLRRTSGWLDRHNEPTFRLLRG